MERNDDWIDRVTIGYILEIVQEFLESGDSAIGDVSQNTALIEEIHSKVNDFARRPKV